jgi:serine/threonine protein phosphatase PrpC
MYSNIEGSNLGERWLYNENHKIRDQDIKEAFKKTETKMEHKSRIDAMFSGTTCVMTFFNNEMIVCANCGDSRAILISE